MNDLLDAPLPKPNSFSFKVSTVVWWAAFLFIGLVFKLMHWPGNGLFILISTAGLASYNWCSFSRLRGKSLFNNVFSILGFFWLMVLLWGIRYNDGYPYNEAGLMLFLLACGIFSAVYIIIFRLKYRSK